MLPRPGDVPPVEADFDSSTGSSIPFFPVAIGDRIASGNSMMPLKVAFVVHAFPAITESFILRQVTGLRDLGHTVHIFAEEPAAPGPVHEEVAEYDLMSDTRHLYRWAWQPNGIGAAAEGWAAGLRSVLSRPRAAARAVARAYTDSGLSRVWASRTLTAFAAEGPYDVVHCHFGDVGTRYGFAAEFLGAPLITSFYGWDCSSYPRALGASVFDRLFDTADRVTALSQEMSDRLEALGCPRERIRILHIGADPEAFHCTERKPKREGEPIRVLTVGRLVEKKGIEYGLRAVANVSAWFPALRYDIVGGGPLRGKLEELARGLGIDDRVTFHGVQTGSFVRQAMCAADVFLAPSVTARYGSQEGTPTVLMEAASAGLPVISTMHAGIPEVVLDGVSGFLVPERDAEALAARLGDLLACAERWAAMGAAGRRHIERNYNVRLLSGELEALYREVLSR